MTLSIAVVCDAEADAATIAAVADAVILREAINAPCGIDPDTLEYFRAYRGFRASEPCLRWSRVRDVARELGIVAPFKNVVPAHPYAQIALRAVRVLAASPDRVDVIILMPDSDGDLTRRAGLEQARTYFGTALPIVIGLPHTKRECWHIAGFEPQDDEENEILDRLRRELGPDPRLHSHELTASNDPFHDKRSAKRILRELTKGDRTREHECLTACQLAILEQRGRDNGFCDFVSEVRTVLFPAVARGPA